MSREYGPTKVRSEVVISAAFGAVMMPETQFLIGLCVRCYLRFKFSSISSFKAELGAIPLPISRLPRTLARHISQPKPLLPLLPSVQILFPASVTPRIGP